MIIHTLFFFLRRKVHGYKVKTQKKKKEREKERSNKLATSLYSSLHTLQKQQYKQRTKPRVYPSIPYLLGCCCRHLHLAVHTYPSIVCVPFFLLFVCLSFFYFFCWSWSKWSLCLRYLPLPSRLARFGEITTTLSWVDWVDCVDRVDWVTDCLVAWLLCPIAPSSRSGKERLREIYQKKKTLSRFAFPTRAWRTPNHPTHSPAKKREKRVSRHKLRFGTFYRFGVPRLKNRWRTKKKTVMVKENCWQIQHRKNSPLERIKKKEGSIWPSRTSKAFNSDVPLAQAHGFISTINDEEKKTANWHWQLRYLSMVSMDGDARGYSGNCFFLHSADPPRSTFLD